MILYQAPPGATAHPLACPAPRRRSTAPTTVYVALEPARGPHASDWRWVVTQVSAEPLVGWWRVDLDPGDPVVRVGDRAALHPPNGLAREQVATIASREAPDASHLEDGDASLSDVHATWTCP